MLGRFSPARDRGSGHGGSRLTRQSYFEDPATSRCCGTDPIDQGWRLYRFTKYEVYGEPDETAAKIERALGA